MVSLNCNSMNNGAKTLESVGYHFFERKQLEDFKMLNCYNFPCGEVAFSETLYNTAEYFYHL